MDDHSPHHFDDEQDDYDDLSSLDFSAPGDELAGLDDYVNYPAVDDEAVHSGQDDEAWPVMAVSADPVSDEPPVPLFTVTNPPGTVTVSAFLDGRISLVELSPRVTRMSESQLADEIVVIAGLATQDARSAQYAFMLEGMRQQGHDDAATRDFLRRDLDLPSPEDADRTRASVFSTRYAGDHD
ncbi:YbaB/EbfC family DNA-binding protein [Mycolicibacterium sediminis]|uniref:Secretion protein EspD n=1 Tax=Mycolicibacterium sediminis TaxID=1286180 RepID=A0A7I7QLQ1_9MYCO|nr:YbaB/EbfC family DNA-binding protein [Mycolicibacterium sediminis]BBY27263.1 hypothetical protein MSEDJ_13590 [Mycolicibacterium sediminis]